MVLPLPYCVVSGESPPELVRSVREMIKTKLEKIAYGQFSPVLLEGPKWDCLVITARNERQKRIFELQLVDVPWHLFAEKVFVVQDPPGIRAGSGGATVWLLKENRQHKYFDLNNDKVLIIHSGGLSRRIPHLSTVGKLFMLLPDDSTLLVYKLGGMRRMVPLLQPGIFISTTNGLEKVCGTTDPIEEDTDLFLLMHRSELDVGTKHGVYVVDDEGQLERVLQKPSEREMIEQGAILSDTADSESWCYTDSAYFISSKTTEKLLEAVGDAPVDTTVCAFADFMRSMGRKPTSESEDVVDINQMNVDEILAWANLHVWRSCLEDCFKDLEGQTLDCGESFFPFGTNYEYIRTLRDGSEHCNQPLLPLHSTWQYKVGMGSIVEYCNLPPHPYTVVGSDSIVSNCFVGLNKNGKKIIIPDNVIVYSTPVERDGRKGWVTVVVGTADDVKKTCEPGHVKWSGTELKDYLGTTLWEAPLFTMTPGPEKSLCQSLRKYEHRATDPEVLCCCGWSMAEVARHVDAEKLVEYRRKRMELWWKCGPESLCEPPPVDEPPCDDDLENWIQTSSRETFDF